MANTLQHGTFEVDFSPVLGELQDSKLSILAEVQRLGSIADASLSCLSKQKGNAFWKGSVCEPPIGIVAEAHATNNQTRNRSAVDVCSASSDVVSHNREKPIPGCADREVNAVNGQNCWSPSRTVLDVVDEETTMAGSQMDSHQQSSCASADIDIEEDLKDLRDDASASDL